MTIAKSTGAIGALVLGLFFASVSGIHAEPLKLRISAENPPNILDVQMASKFAELLKAELGDEFEFELFHTKALGDETVHLQMIRTGQIDVYPMGSDALKLDPSLAVFEMPFLFKDREAVAALLDGEIGAALGKSLREKSGLELLAFGELGFRQMANNTRPIVKPEDLAGIKLRVPGSEARILSFKELGASPVTINLGELYLALQQGTVDGLEVPLGTMKASSFYEVIKYLSISNHLYTPVTFVMNGAKYDSLSPELQATVKKAALEAAKYTRGVGAEQDATLVKELGATVAVNEIDYDTFAAASKPIWDKISEIAGKDISAKVIQAASQ